MRVSYWETKASVDPGGGAPKRMLEVLGVRVVPYKDTTTRAREDVVLHWMTPDIADAIAREQARLADSVSTS